MVFVSNGDCESYIPDGCSRRLQKSFCVQEAEGPDPVASLVPALLGEVARARCRASCVAKFGACKEIRIWQYSKNLIDVKTGAVLPK
jgi:hypothetical protein